MRRGLKLLVVSAVGLIASSLWAAAPTGRYTLAVDTVKDNKTALTWQRAVPSSTYTHTNAASYCQGLSLGGFSSGWRLPTKKELETLVDRRVTNPSIDSTAFPSTPLEEFWTSTPSAGSPGSVWYVNFDDGDSYYHVTTHTGRVRCVR